jgi:hypothetical protein
LLLNFTNKNLQHINLFLLPVWPDVIFYSPFDLRAVSFVMSLVARQATLPVRFTRACSSLKPVPAISQGGMHISAFINVTAFTSLAPHLLLANKADARSGGMSAMRIAYLYPFFCPVKHKGNMN